MLPTRGCHELVDVAGFSLSDASRLPRGMQLQLMGYCFVALTGFTAFSWAFSWLAAEMLGVAREALSG